MGRDWPPFKPDYHHVLLCEPGPVFALEVCGMHGDALTQLQAWRAFRCRVPCDRHHTEVEDGAESFMTHVS